MNPQSDQQSNTIAVPMKEDLKLAALLGVLGALATAALFPYLLIIMPEALSSVRIPLPALIAVQSLQAAALLTLLSFFGLRMGHYVGLDAPWLRALLFRRERHRQPWLAAVALGAFAGLLIVSLDPLFAPYLPAQLHSQAATTAQASAMAGFLASFYGAIGEELQLRLFLMTLLVWSLSKLAGDRATPLQFWIALILAALLFGAGHLPAAASIWPLDAVVVSRVIVLNSVAGLIFGWLYWRHGLESAMLSHFSADLILHVVVPLVSG